MKLQVTEKIESLLNNETSKTVSVFSFTNGKTIGKLNYGTVFQGVVQKEDKTVTVSLIRQTGENTFEAYDTKILHASSSATFNDRSTTHSISMTFKLVN